jgi:hypothetical protein
MAHERVTFETNPLADFCFWLARRHDASATPDPDAGVSAPALHALAERVAVHRITDFGDVLVRLEDGMTLPAAATFPAGHAPSLPPERHVAATLRLAARHWPAHGRYWREARRQAEAACEQWRAEQAADRPLAVLERVTGLQWPASHCRVLACPSLTGSLASKTGVIFGGLDGLPTGPPRLAVLMAHEGVHVLIAESLRRHEDLNELVAVLGDAGWQPASVRANLGEILAIALQHRILVETGHGSPRDLFEGRLGESLRASVGEEDRRSEMHGEFFEEIYWELQYEWDAYRAGGASILDHLAGCLREVAEREGWLPA